jgi:hypothetical protein
LASGPLASDPLVREIERDFHTHISYDFDGTWVVSATSGEKPHPTLLLKFEV